MHLVADLTHLSTESYMMSICSVGIMGASIVRDEPVPEAVRLTLGEKMDIAVPHLYDEFTPSLAQNTNLRLAGDASKFSFVTLVEDQESGKSIIRIDTQGVEVGEYDIVFESFDSESIVQATQMTDVIKLTIESLISHLSGVSVSAVEQSSWTLDKIDPYLLSGASIAVESSLGELISYDKRANAVTFSGNKHTSGLAGTIKQIKLLVTAQDSGGLRATTKVITFISEIDQQQDLT